MELHRLRHHHSHRTDDKLQMLNLNQRLETYLGRVRLLEEENKLLCQEIQALRGSGQGGRMGLEDKLSLARQEVEEVWREKDRVELELGSLGEELYVLGLQRQWEADAHGEVKKKLADSRKQMEEERRAQIWLGEKVSQLEKQIQFQIKTHQEDVAGFQATLIHVRPALPPPPPQTGTQLPSLQELGEEYSQMAVRAWHEAAMVFQGQVDSLDESLNQARTRLAQVGQEKNESQLKLHALENELQSAQDRRQCLERSVAKQRDMQRQEIQNLQAHLDVLEMEKGALGNQIDTLLTESRGLLQLKMSLGMEVATYRALLDNESLKGDFSSTNQLRSTYISDGVPSSRGVKQSFQTQLATSHMIRPISTIHRASPRSNVTLMSTSPIWTQNRVTLNETPESCRKTGEHIDFGVGSNHQVSCSTPFPKVPQDGISAHPFSPQDVHKEVNYAEPLSPPTEEAGADVVSWLGSDHKEQSMWDLEKEEEDQNIVRTWFAEEKPVLESAMSHRVETSFSMPTVFSTDAQELYSPSVSYERAGSVTGAHSAFSANDDNDVPFEMSFEKEEPLLDLPYGPMNASEERDLETAKKDAEWVGNEGLESETASVLEQAFETFTSSQAFEYGAGKSYNKPIEFNQEDNMSYESTQASHGSEEAFRHVKRLEEDVIHPPKEDENDMSNKHEEQLEDELHPYGYGKEDRERLGGFIKENDMTERIDKFNQEEMISYESAQASHWSEEVFHHVERVEEGDIHFTKVDDENDMSNKREEQHALNPNGEVKDAWDRVGGYNEENGIGERMYDWKEAKYHVKEEEMWNNRETKPNRSDQEYIPSNEEKLKQFEQEQIPSGGEKLNQSEQRYINSNGEKLNQSEQRYINSNGEKLNQSEQEQIPSGGEKLNQSEQRYINSNGEKLNQSEQEHIPSGGEKLNQSEQEQIPSGGEKLNQSEQEHIPSGGEKLNQSEQEQIPSGGEKLNQSEQEQIPSGGEKLNQSEQEQIPSGGEKLNQSEQEQIPSGGQKLNQSEQEHIPSGGEKLNQSEQEQIPSGGEKLNQSEQEQIPSGGEKLNQSEQEHIPSGGEKLNQSEQEQIPSGGEKLNQSEQEQIPSGGEKLNQSEQEHIPSGGEKLNQSEQEQIPSCGEKLNQSEQRYINSNGEKLNQSEQEHIPSGGEKLNQSEQEHIPSGGEKLNQSEQEQIPSGGEKLNQSEQEHIPSGGEKLNQSEQEQIPSGGEKLNQSEQEQIPSGGEKLNQSEQEQIPSGGEKLNISDNDKEDHDEANYCQNNSVSCRAELEGDSYAQDNTLADTHPLIRYKSDETDVNTQASHMGESDSSDGEEDREVCQTGTDTWGEGKSKQFDTMEDLCEESEGDVIDQERNMGSTHQEDMDASQTKEHATQENDEENAVDQLIQEAEEEQSYEELTEPGEYSMVCSDEDYNEERIDRLVEQELENLSISSYSEHFTGQMIESESVLSLQIESHTELNQTQDILYSEEVEQIHSERLNQSEQEYIPSGGEKRNLNAQEHIPSDGENLNQSEQEYIPSGGEKLNLYVQENIPSDGEKLNQSEPEYIISGGEKLNQSETEDITSGGETLDICEQEHISSDREKMNQSEQENIPLGGEKLNQSEPEYIISGGEKLSQSEQENIPSGGEKMNQSDPEYIPSCAEKLNQSEQECIPSGAEKLNQSEQECIPSGAEKQNQSEQECIPPGAEKQNQSEQERIPSGGEKLNQSEQERIPSGGEKLNQSEQECIPPGAEKLNQSEQERIPSGGEKLNQSEQECIPSGGEKLNQSEQERIPSGGEKLNQSEQERIPPGAEKQNQSEQECISSEVMYSVHSRILMTPEHTSVREGSVEISKAEYLAQGKVFSGGLGTEAVPDKIEGQDDQNLYMSTHADFTESHSIYSSLNSRPESQTDMNNLDIEESNSTDDESPNASQYLQPVTKANLTADQEDLLDVAVSHYEDCNTLIKHSAEEVTSYQASNECLQTDEWEVLESPNKHLESGDPFAGHKRDSERSSKTDSEGRDLHSFLSSGVQNNFWGSNLETGAPYQPDEPYDHVTDLPNQNLALANNLSWVDLENPQATNWNTKMDSDTPKASTLEEEDKQMPSQVKQLVCKDVVEGVNVTSEGSEDGDSWSSGEE
uniref:nestin-like isoform X2 n=1 Tax=Oncorhynchus gorbuscha TaxID=8017 RepID=UPI001EAF4BB3|nr:nestin-like isoform X2 [Oncorhynchus gorbuscha]